MKIYCVSGKSRTGKDFIAQNIFLPRGYMQFSLAWHFKVWLVSTGKATYDEVFVTKPPHVRKLLQEEGTERGRDVYGTNIWCDTAWTWLEVLARHNPSITGFVIPDLRFKNELAYFEGKGAIVYRIIAPDREANNGLSEDARRHPSETDLDDVVNFSGGFITNFYGTTISGLEYQLGFANATY